MTGIHPQFHPLADEGSSNAAKLPAISNTSDVKVSSHHGTLFFPFDSNFWCKSLHIEGEICTKTTSIEGLGYPFVMPWKKWGVRKHGGGMLYLTRRATYLQWGELEINYVYDQSSMYVCFQLHLCIATSKHMSLPLGSSTFQKGHRCGKSLEPISLPASKFMLGWFHEKHQ